MDQLLSQLRAWHRRERLYRLAWGGSRVVVVAVLAATIACLIDWVIDLDRDTPYWLRFLMTAGQLALLVTAVRVFLVRLGVPSLDALAVTAESVHPQFGHRLVTALQLNRPSARTAGMSAELIAAVTREAEQLVARHDLPALADRSLPKHAACLLAPVTLLAVLCVLFNPKLTFALLARQVLLPVDIPRPVEVINVTPEIWPTGEEVELRFAVSGRVPEGATGLATVTPDDGPWQRFRLEILERTADGDALFVTKLPASSDPFTFTARAAGGRTRAPGRVRFEPRPVVRELSAWVIMPAYVDPDGERRFERYQSQGEVFAYPDCAVRVEATISKPVSSGFVIVFGRNSGGVETEMARVPMDVSPDRRAASATFDPPPQATSYRVQVADENGFANAPQPRRVLNIASDQPPQGRLLDEVLRGPSDDGPLSDYEVNGMPLALGGQVQVGYSVQSPLGVARAYLVYRVNDGPWSALPLAHTDADPARVGRFLPELGVFEWTPFNGQVEFYPLPSADPEVEPSGLVAGGRVNFQTASLSKPGRDGKPTKLQVGDRVEYFVAAYDRNPAPAESPEPAEAGDDMPGRRRVRSPWRSESRFKTVVTEYGLHEWLTQRDQTRAKLRDLEASQRGVFVPGRP